MESSIRDILIFWKLSWGLENDHTFFQKSITFAIPKPEKRYALQKLMTWSYIPNIDRGPLQSIMTNRIVAKTPSDWSADTAYIHSRQKNTERVEVARHVARHYAMCAQGATLPLPPLVPDCMATHGIPLWNQTLDDLISRNIACRDKQRVKNQEKHLWEIIRWCSMSQYKLVEVLTFDTATQSACNLHFPVGFGAPLLPSRSAKILGVPGFPGWVSNRSKLGVYDTLNQHLCLSCLERLANMKIMNYEDSFDESLIYVWYLRESCKKRNKSSRNALAV